VSLGDSWHNSHHAFPALARHGCDRGQLDPSAALLKAFEHLGWVSHVRWPNPEQLIRKLAR
jgi:stearoyl-CoA desaturase (delta-9 desaturase)